MNGKTRDSIWLLTLSLACFLSAGSIAQEVDEFGDEVKEERKAEGGNTWLDVESGYQVVGQDGNSSKFNEYRDNDTDPYLYRLFFGMDDAETGRFVDFRGHQMFRSDQEFYVEAGSFGRPGNSRKINWSADLEWSETPHVISNSATSAFDLVGGNTYRVARETVDGIQISNVDNASSWTAADAGPGGAGEDGRIAAVLSDSVRRIALGTDRQTGTATFNLFFAERTKASLQLTRDDKDGSIVTGAAIGDRPPRSLVVQLAEPVDYSTQDIAVSLEHAGGNYQLDATYRYSAFENDVDDLTFDSLFHAPDFFCAAIPECAGAADYDRIRQGSTTEYATQGRIALSPDNTMQSFTANGSFILPWRSRLSASIGFTRMEQDESLLPYATSDFGDLLAALPRSSADAEIETTLVNLSYSINPLSRLNLKFDYRRYDLENNTQSDEWAYFTQDSSSRSFLSQRINVPFGFDQDRYGVGLSYYLGRLGTLGLDYNREQIDRQNREVKTTDEDTFKFSYRSQPTRWSTFTASYVAAERNGTAYEGEVTDVSYSYDPFAFANQGDNPILGFANAPGLRKFDVADRDRDELQLSLALVPYEGVNVNFAYHRQENDYRGDVPATITTWDSVLLDFVTASIDPTRLGLLGDDTRRYAADVSYSSSEHLSFSAYYSREELESRQRGRFLEEAARLAGIGDRDWQDTTGANIWNATIADDTDTVGVAVNYTAVEDKLSLIADFSHSRGKVGIGYVAGASIAEDDATSVHDFAEWTSPANVKFDTNSVNISLRRVLTERLTIGLGYTFERYRVRDWQQQATGEHQNPLNENFVADQDPETQGTSQDRAGSRLVRLGGILAPGYDVHMGIVTFGYRW